MTAYYNEIDPFAADWLENLIYVGAIAPGVVDRRSIEDVTPDDLKGFTQCHWFAGIGVWSYALRQAGVPDSYPVWTGSCPCQPFSQAGQGAGFDDERHLWPAFHHLVTLCGPELVLGEQVSSKDGLAWLDLVQSDVEATGYAFGALDLCAAGVGAPHIRQRSYWMAHANSQLHDGRGNAGTRRRSELADRRSLDELADPLRAGNESRALPGVHRGESSARPRDGEFERPGTTRVVGNSHDARLERRCALPECADQCASGASVVAGGLADADGRQCDRIPNGEGRERNGQTPGRDESDSLTPASGVIRLERPGPTNGYWRDVDWLGCTDGKWRPVEPGTFPLASRTPNRVGALRGYGNAINAPLATEFIKVVREYLDEGY